MDMGLLTLNNGLFPSSHNLQTSYYLDSFREKPKPQIFFLIIPQHHIRKYYSISLHLLLNLSRTLTKLTSTLEKDFNKWLGLKNMSKFNMKDADFMRLSECIINSNFLQNSLFIQRALTSYFLGLNFLSNEEYFSFQSLIISVVDLFSPNIRTKSWEFFLSFDQNLHPIFKGYKEALFQVTQFSLF